MRTEPVGIKPFINRKSERYETAKKGALYGAGLLTVTTGITWAVNNQKMKHILNDYGSRSKYIKNFLVSLSLVSVVSGLLNVFTHEFSQKIPDKKNPTAVN